MTSRTLQRTLESIPTSDGAGVKLRRGLGQTPYARLDPFLMLDHFSTDNADDYIAGFPPHPHRGFETVTYMLDGHMRHEDHLGNRGDLGPGDVQWMTAARGIIHSEMPQQSVGRMRGFQLWLNGLGLLKADRGTAIGCRLIAPEGAQQIENASARLGYRKRGGIRHIDRPKKDAADAPSRLPQERRLIRKLTSLQAQAR